MMTIIIWLTHRKNKITFLDASTKTGWWDGDAWCTLRDAHFESTVLLPSSICLLIFASSLYLVSYIPSRSFFLYFFFLSAVQKKSPHHIASLYNWLPQHMHATCLEENDFACLLLLLMCIGISGRKRRMKWNEIAIVWPAIREWWERKG